MHILETMRQSLDLSVGTIRYVSTDGRALWRLDASSREGERWMAEDEDLYHAAVMLAELVGFDLEE